MNCWFVELPKEEARCTYDKSLNETHWVCFNLKENAYPEFLLTRDTQEAMKFATRKDALDFSDFLEAGNGEARAFREKYGIHSSVYLTARQYPFEM